MELKCNSGLLVSRCRRPAGRRPPPCVQTAGPAELQRDGGEEPGVWNNTPLALSLCVSHPPGRQPGRIGISPSGGLESCPLVAYLLVPILPDPRRPLCPEYPTSGLHLPSWKNIPSCLSFLVLGEFRHQPGRGDGPATIVGGAGRDGEEGKEVPGDSCISPGRWYLLA